MCEYVRICLCGHVWVCVYTFGSSLRCVMFIHCLFGHDTESACLWPCVSMPVCTPAFVNECLSLMGIIMSCECLPCMYVYV